jgi:hypothetical protein
MPAPLRITFKLDGPAQVIDYLKAVVRKFPGAAAAAVYIEALGVLRRARSNVPVDTSLLVNSVWCSLPDAQSGNPTAVFGYAAPYALAVHERTEVHHVVGHAGWLREAMEAAQNGYAQRVLARTLAYAKEGVNAPSPDSQIPTSPDTEVMLAKVKAYLARDKSRTKDQRTIAYGKVQRLLDQHEQRQRARHGAAVH